MFESIKVLLILLITISINCMWETTFKDLFDDNNLNQTKWTVVDEKDWKSANTRIFNNKLVLMAKKEGNGFTSAKIKLNQAFKHARFRVKATLADGLGLTSYIYLMPETQQAQSSIDGIVIIKDEKGHSQYGTSETGMINYTAGQNEYESKDYQFQSTEKKLTWSINQHKKEMDNYNESYFEQKFNLFISLDINMNEIAVNPSEWNCSLLIIDQVEVQQGKTIGTPSILELPDIVRSNFPDPTLRCADVMKEIKEQDDSTTTVKTTTVKTTTVKEPTHGTTHEPRAQNSGQFNTQTIFSNSLCLTILTTFYFNYI